MKGAHNPVPNALSRIAINALAQRQDIDFEGMAKAQEELSNLSSSMSLKLSKVLIPASTARFVCDLSTGVFHDRWSLLYSCSTASTPSPTPEFELRNVSSLVGMSGQTSSLMCAGGHNHAYSAREPRSRDIP